MAGWKLALTCSPWRATEQFLEQHVSDLVTHNHMWMFLVKYKLVQQQMKRKESQILLVIDIRSDDSKHAGGLFFHNFQYFLSKSVFQLVNKPLRFIEDVRQIACNRQCMLDAGGIMHRFTPSRQISPWSGQCKSLMPMVKGSRRKTERQLGCSKHWTKLFQTLGRVFLT